MRTNAELIAEARDEHFEDMWADGSPCCPVCNCSWPCDASRLADALEAAEAGNAALLEIATAAVSACANDDWRNRWMEALDKSHPGESLLREIAALREVAEAAKGLRRSRGVEFEVAFAKVLGALAAWEGSR